MSTAPGGASPPAGTTIERPPRIYAGYALDLDGTIYLGNRLLPGAADTVAALRAAGSRVVFLTNNALATAADYADRLSRLGVPASPGDVVTSVHALVRYLTLHHPGERLLTVAESVVEHELSTAGFPLTTRPRDAQAVVVSFDRRFDYRKLRAAYRAVRGGAVIVATNPDPYCPTPDGGLPDCAAMLAAIEACTERTAEAVVGKPSVHMAAACLDRLGVSAGNAAVIGDRLDTDVALGIRAGMTAVLVLSGATDSSTLGRSTVRPDYVLPGLGELLADDVTHRCPGRVTS